MLRQANKSLKNMYISSILSEFQRKKYWAFTYMRQNLNDKQGNDKQNLGYMYLGRRECNSGESRRVRTFSKKVEGKVE